MNDRISLRTVVFIGKSSFRSGTGHRFGQSEAGKPQLLSHITATSKCHRHLALVWLVKAFGYCVQDLGAWFETVLACAGDISVCLDITQQAAAGVYLSVEDCANPSRQSHAA